MNPPVAENYDVVAKTVFGLMGLGGVILCRVFWGALKRNAKKIWALIKKGDANDMPPDPHCPAQSGILLKEFEPLIPEMLAFFQERRTITEGQLPNLFLKVVFSVMDSW